MLDGLSILKFREDRGWSQEHMAKMLGVSQPTVGRLEKKKNLKPLYENALRSIEAMHPAQEPAE